MDQPPVVVRGYLPQRLLPPHRARDDTQQAAAGILDRALRRLASPDKCGRYGAAKQQKPKYRFGKTCIRKRIDRISERILQHGFCSRWHGNRATLLKSGSSCHGRWLSYAPANCRMFAFWTETISDRLRSIDLNS